MGRLPAVTGARSLAGEDPGTGAYRDGMN